MTYTFAGRTIYGYQTYPATSGASTGTSVAGGNGAWGSWVEIVASTAQADYLFGMWVYTGTDFTQINIDLGFGAGAAEVSKFATTLGDFGTTGAFQPLWVPFPLPIACPASTRIAVRIGNNSGTNASAVSVLYAPQANLG